MFGGGIFVEPTPVIIQTATDHWGAIATVIAAFVGAIALFWRRKK